jgi:hypothetical protein
MSFTLIDKGHKISADQFVIRGDRRTFFRKISFKKSVSKFFENILKIWKKCSAIQTKVCSFHKVGQGFSLTIKGCEIYFFVCHPSVAWLVVYSVSSQNYASVQESFTTRRAHRYDRNRSDAQTETHLCSVTLVLLFEFATLFEAAVPDPLI